MGTFNGSKFVTARKDYDCYRSRCKISKGDRYLRYALGLKSRVPVCLGCAFKDSKYTCRAVEEARSSAITPEQV